MTYFKRFLIVALVALLGALAWMNRASLGQPVELHFLNYAQTLAFGLWFLIAFASGLLISLMIALPGSMSTRRELRYKSQALAQVEFELSRMQNGAAQGDTGAVAIQPPVDFAKRLGL